MKNALYSLYYRLIDIVKFPRKLFRWFIKSIKYSAFLWNDSDFDYFAILNLLKFKFSMMRKAMLSPRAVSSQAHFVALQLEHAEKLIENCFDDPITAKKSKDFEARWGETTFDFSPGNSGSHLKFSNAKTEEEQSRARDELDKIFTEETENEKEYWDLLFEHMKNNMKEWWD